MSLINDQQKKNAQVTTPTIKPVKSAALPSLTPDNTLPEAAPTDEAAFSASPTFVQPQESLPTIPEGQQPVDGTGVQPPQQQAPAEEDVLDFTPIAPVEIQRAPERTIPATLPLWKDTTEQLGLGAALKPEIANTSLPSFSVSTPDNSSTLNQAFASNQSAIGRFNNEAKEQYQKAQQVEAQLNQRGALPNTPDATKRWYSAPLGFLGDVLFGTERARKLSEAGIPDAGAGSFGRAGAGLGGEINYALGVLPNLFVGAVGEVNKAAANGLQALGVDKKNAEGFVRNGFLQFLPETNDRSGLGVLLNKDFRPSSILNFNFDAANKRNLLADAIAGDPLTDVNDPDGAVKYGRIYTRSQRKEGSSSTDDPVGFALQIGTYLFNPGEIPGDHLIGAGIDKLFNVFRKPVAKAAGEVVQNLPALPSSSMRAEAELAKRAEAARTATAGRQLQTPPAQQNFGFDLSALTEEQVRKLNTGTPRLNGIVEPELPALPSSGQLANTPRAGEAVEFVAPGAELNPPRLDYGEARIEYKINPSKPTAANPTEMPRVYLGERQVTRAALPPVFDPSEVPAIKETYLLPYSTPAKTALEIGIGKAGLRIEKPGALAVRPLSQVVQAIEEADPKLLQDFEGTTWGELKEHLSAKVEDIGEFSSIGEDLTQTSDNIDEGVLQKLTDSFVNSRIEGKQSVSSKHELLSMKAGVPDTDALQDWQFNIYNANKEDLRAVIEKFAPANATPEVIDEVTNAFVKKSLTGLNTDSSKSAMLFVKYGFEDTDAFQRALNDDFYKSHADYIKEGYRKALSGEFKPQTPVVDKTSDLTNKFIATRTLKGEQQIDAGFNFSAAQKESLSGRGDELNSFVLREIFDTPEATEAIAKKLSEVVSDQSVLPQMVELAKGSFRGDEAAKDEFASLLRRYAKGKLDDYNKFRTGGFWEDAGVQERVRQKFDELLNTPKKPIKPTEDDLLTAAEELAQHKLVLEKPLQQLDQIFDETVDFGRRTVDEVPYDIVDPRAALTTVENGGILKLSPRIFLDDSREGLRVRDAWLSGDYDFLVQYGKKRGFSFEELLNNVIERNNTYITQANRIWRQPSVPEALTTIDGSLFHGTALDQWTPPQNLYVNGSRGELGHGTYYTLDKSVATDYARARVGDNVSPKTMDFDVNPTVAELDHQFVSTLDARLPLPKEKLRQAFYDLPEPILKKFSASVNRKKKPISYVQMRELVELSIVKAGVEPTEELLLQIDADISKNLRGLGFDSIVDKESGFVLGLDNSRVAVKTLENVPAPSTIESATARFNADSFASKHYPNHLSTTANLHDSTYKTLSQTRDAVDKKLSQVQDEIIQRGLPEQDNILPTIPDTSTKPQSFLETIDELADDGVCGI